MRNIEQHASETVNKVLVGNKCDMDDKRVIPTARGQALADEFGIPFFETSAKAGPAAVGRSPFQLIVPALTRRILYLPRLIVFPYTLGASSTLA